MTSGTGLFCFFHCLLALLASCLGAGCSDCDVAENPFIGRADVCQLSEKWSPSFGADKAGPSWLLTGIARFVVGGDFSLPLDRSGAISRDALRIIFR